MFGGTWERIKDTFLLASGTFYAAGISGGEATHTLTVSEMPSHTHTQLGISADDANTSPIRQEFQNDGNAVWNTNTSCSNDKVYRRSRINVDGATGSKGGSSAHNNMPPYLAVYMWKRTA